jgi:hypothetical protein
LLPLAGEFSGGVHAEGRGCHHWAKVQQRAARASIHGMRNRISLRATRGSPQVALGLLAFMSWNLRLWCQLRRLHRHRSGLRRARAERAGRDVHRRGETPIEVGQGQSAFIGAVAAMCEFRSFLEQRIKS